MMITLTTKWNSLMLLLFAVIVAGCEGEEANVPAEKAPESQGASTISKLPKIKLIDASEGGSRIGDFTNPDTFDFSEGANGITFTSSAGVTFVDGPDGEYILIDINSFSGGGGSVQVGNKSYDMDIAFCFTADDEFLETGSDELGVSGIIGISGLSKVTSLEELESLEELPIAVAYFIVFSQPASGKYPVLDGQAEDFEHHHAVAYVVDYESEDVYSSSQGFIDVSQSSMTYEGKFFASTLANDEEYREVSGSGTMVCQ